MFNTVTYGKAVVNYMGAFKYFPPYPMNPLTLLEKGYSIASTTHQIPVKTVSTVAIGDMITTECIDGSFVSCITDINYAKKNTKKTYR